MSYLYWSSYSNQIWLKKCRSIQFFWVKCILRYREIQMIEKISDELGSSQFISVQIIESILQKKRIPSNPNHKGHWKRVVVFEVCIKMYLFNFETVNQSCIIFIILIICLYDFILIPSFMFELSTCVFWWSGI